MKSRSIAFEHATLSSTHPPGQILPYPDSLQHIASIWAKSFFQFITINRTSSWAALTIYAIEFMVFSLCQQQQLHQQLLYSHKGTTTRTTTTKHEVQVDRFRARYAFKHASSWSDPAIPGISATHRVYLGQVVLLIYYYK